VGQEKLSTLPELTVSQLFARVSECEVDIKDAPLLLGMVAALQQRPELVTKVSGQISGMGQQQTIEILNIQAGRTVQEILESIQQLDPATLSSDALDEGAVKDPVITNANGQGLSSYTTMRIADLPISDTMLSTLRQGGLAGMEEWFFRPHQPRAARGDLPGVAIRATDGSQKMLALLRAAGMTKVQIEQLVLSMMNKQLEGTEAAGTVVDVFFYDTKDRVVVDEKKQVRNIRGAVDFVEVGRGLVTLKEKAHEGFVVQHLNMSLDFTLGAALGVPALDQIRAVFPIVRRFSGKLRDELAQTGLQAAEEKARAFLIDGGGAMMRVQAQLVYDFRDGMRTQALKGTSRRHAERELKALLGDAPLGILAVAMTKCPDSNTVQWRDELNIYVQGPDLAQNLIARLGSGVKGAVRGASPEDVIKAVRLDKKTSPTVTTINRKQVSRPVAASATVADLEAAIVTGVFSSDHTVTFPAQTKDGAAIIWASQPATETEDSTQQTTLEELPNVRAEEGFTDLRSILEDSALEYNAAVLLQALMNLMGNKSLLVETSDDDTHFLIFSARKYQAQAKRRRAADQEGAVVVEDEAADDNEDQNMETRSPAKRGFGGDFKAAAGRGSRGRGGGRPA